MTEHEEQRNFVRWFRQNYPAVRIFAIANGGLRSASVAMKLKVEGVSPGVPDLFIPAMLTWIEMKRKTGGVLSKEQQDWIQYLRGCKHRVIVAKGCDDAIEQLEENHA
jgi:hypothetical protein